MIRSHSGTLALRSGAFLKQSLGSNPSKKTYEESGAKKAREEFQHEEFWGRSAERGFPDLF